VVYLREVVKRLAAIKLEPAKPNAAPLWHLPDDAPKDGADDESTYVDSDSVGGDSADTHPRAAADADAAADGGGGAVDDGAAAADADAGPAVAALEPAVASSSAAALVVAATAAAPTTAPVAAAAGLPPTATIGGGGGGANAARRASVSGGGRRASLKRGSGAAVPVVALGAPVDRRDEPAIAMSSPGLLVELLGEVTASTRRLLSMTVGHASSWRGRDDLSSPHSAPRRRLFRRSRRS